MADIVQDIQALSAKQRLELLRALIADLDGPADADADEAWLTEAERREREYESGQIQLPAEERLREAEQLLRR